MTETELLERLEQTGALRRGHFRLSSGLHSNVYVQCAKLLEEPATAIQVGEDLAAAAGDEIDLVVCPALGAVVIGFTTALALGCRMVFAERKGGRFEIRRGFTVEPGTRVLVVEDVVTTGGSALELARLVEEAGGVVRAIACIVGRGPVDTGDFPLVNLVRLDAETYSPDDCPLCRAGGEAEAPGSRYLSG